MISNNDTVSFSAILGENYEEIVEFFRSIDEIVTTDLQSIDNILLQLNQKLRGILSVSSPKFSFIRNPCL